MSYEGYSQNLCEMGHRFDSPDLYHVSKEPLCPFCKSKICWSNSVDQTNGFDEGFISETDFLKFEEKPELQETCNLGHVHVTQQRTYLIPSEDEQRKMRTVIIDWKNNSPVRKYYST